MRAAIRDQSGAALVLTLVMLTVLMGVAALAVDVGLLYSARGEAQRAADAAALAGASAFTEYDGRTAVDSARARAIRFAVANEILHSPVRAQRVAVDVMPESSTVRVTVRGARVPLWFARILGQDSAAVSGRAAARAADATTASCVKPFAPADPAPATTGSGSGQHAFQAGESVDLLGGSATGGPSEAWDPGDHDSLEPCAMSQNYNSNSGPYLANSICSCHGATVSTAGQYREIQGKKVGPVRAGTEALLSQDAGAYWDPVRQVVAGSSYKPWKESPRVVIVPLYDPAESGWGTLGFSRFVYVFVESYQHPGHVRGRYVGPVQNVQLVE